jgi:Terminase large subunit, T4likevirus-type, N-terminal
MLANDIAAALDPCLLMEQLGLAPDRWQEEFLRSPADRQLLLCTRQAGKSTAAAVLALHESLYGDDALVLLLSPSQRQSQELFRKLTYAYARLKQAPSPTVENSLRLELPNGSRIVSLPGKEETVRGFSGATLIVIDEAARVPDELYFAVRPMLAVSSGRLICLSTPFGKRGFFYEEWTKGPRWNRFSVTADQCPRISPEFLEEERRALGPHWFAQEYMCEFVDTTHRVFPDDLIMSAVDDRIAPLPLTRSRRL